MRMAAQHGSNSALVLLLTRDQTRVILHDCYISCFTEAVLNGRTDTLQYLMSQDARKCPSKLLEKAFVHAAHKGYFSIMTSLAQRICDYESYPVTLAQALNAACASGTIDIVQWLIKAGAEIDKLVDCIPKLVPEVENEKLRRPWCLTRDRVHENWPRTALEASLQPFLVPYERHQYGEGGNEAKRLRQEPVIKLLLENGADVNQIVAGKTTPLHVAALNCSEQIVRALIAKGADANADIPADGTPLQSAAKRELNPLSIVRILLESGAIVCPHDDTQQQNPALSEALSFFGGPPSETRTQYMSGPVANWSERGRFFASESLQEVLSSGPGAVIKLLLLSQQKLQAVDERFNLLLQMLAVDGDIEFIRLLIDRDIDVNLRGHYYGCALQAASRFGYLECVQLLLKAGAQVNLVEGIYGTPLQAAIVGRHQEIVTTLIAHGADVNLYSKISLEEIACTPPVKLAIQTRQLVLAMQLLNVGAKISEGMPVLHLAIEATDFDAAERLLAAGADVNAGDREHLPVLITACQNGDMRTIEFLFARGADVNVGGTRGVGQDEASALHAACGQGYSEIVRMLLNQGAHVEKTGKDDVTPLGLAVSVGNLEMMELLLGFGARIYDPSADLNVLKQATQSPEPQATMEFLVQRLSNSPELVAACEEALPNAFRRGDRELFLTLLDEVPKTPSSLGQACRLGSQDAVRYVLSHGVDIDSDLGKGVRALHIAVYHQRVEMVALLIHEGADVRHASPTYGAPISAALEGLLASTHDGKLPRNIFPEEAKGVRFHASTDRPKHDVCVKMIDILLRAGAEVNPTVTKIGAPLHVASYMGELSTIRLLLEKGADINAAGGYFGSALIAAMINDQEEAISLLLERGINVNICSERLGTALHCACRRKDRETVQILLKYGADPNGNGHEFESPIAALLSRLDWLRSRESLRKILDLLLQSGDRLKVREADLIAIIEAAEDTPKLLDAGFFEALCQHYIDLPVSQKLIAATVASVDECDPTNHLECLLERASGVEINPEIFKSVQSSKALELLLQHQPRCAITPDIFEALDDVTIDRPEHLQILLSRAPEFRFPNELVENVVSDELGAEFLKVILRHDKDLRISQGSLNACLEEGSPDCLELILENNPELALPLELILKQFKHFSEKERAFEMLEVLVRLGKKQEFTPEVHRAIQEQFQLQSESQIKQLFLSLEKRD